MFERHSIAEKMVVFCLDKAPKFEVPLILLAEVGGCLESIRDHSQPQNHGHFAPQLPSGAWGDECLQPLHHHSQSRGGRRGKSSACLTLVETA